MQDGIIALYVLWTLFLWIDFLVKRNSRPKNYVRRRVFVIAAVARTNLSGETERNCMNDGEDRAEEAGFSISPEEEWQMQFYAAFFIANAVCKAFIYSPVADKIAHWVVSP